MTGRAGTGETRTREATRRTGTGHTGTTDAATYVGGPENGQPIVFVHGAGLSWRMWLPQVRALDDEFRVIAPDLPGHGRRTDQRFTLAAARLTVADALAEGTDRPALLVGQSLGGYVAIDFASHHPERVAGLLLSGASADYRGTLGVTSALAGLFNRIRAAVGPLERRFRESVEATLRDGDLPPATVEAILDGGISLAGYGQGAMAIAGADWHGKLRGYEGPVLLVNGMDDRLNPGPAAELAPTLHDAASEVIPDSGHTCSLDRPERYTDLLREFATDRVWNVVSGRTNG